MKNEISVYIETDTLLGVYRLSGVLLGSIYDLLLPVDRFVVFTSYTMCFSITLNFIILFLCLRLLL